MDSDRLLYIILDTLRNSCTLHENCDDCILADDKGACCLATIPEHWQPDVIRNNLEKRADK